MDFEIDLDISMKQMLAVGEVMSEETQRIRLKEYQLNLILLAYLRYYKQNRFF